MPAGHCAEGSAKDVLRGATSSRKIHQKADGNGRTRTMRRTHEPSGSGGTLGPPTLAVLRVQHGLMHRPLRPQLDRRGGPDRPPRAQPRASPQHGANARRIPGLVQRLQNITGRDVHARLDRGAAAEALRPVRRRERHARDFGGTLGPPRPSRRPSAASESLFFSAAATRMAVFAF